MHGEARNYEKKKYFKRDFIDFQQFRGLKTKKINKNVMKWMFSHWPCYRSLARRIGLWMAELALGFAVGQYSHPQVSTTDLRPATGPV